MRLARHVLSTMPFIVVVLAAGCGRGISPPSSTPVSGVVTLAGKPADGIRVTFHPQYKTRFIPSGETRPDGTFTLNTGAAGNGAPPGDYLVTFEKPRIESDRQNSGIEMEVDELQGRYSDPAKSAWKVTVKWGSNTLPPFQLD